LIDADQIKAALSNPRDREKLRRALDRANVEDLSTDHPDCGLMGFHRRAWAIMDPAPYVHGRHLETIARELEDVITGKTRFLLINIAPRHSKSLMVSVSFPALVWALPPTAGPLAGAGVQFLSVSYAQQLATRDALKARRLMLSPWYSARWGVDSRIDGLIPRVVFSGDQNQKTRYDNTSGGHRIAVGFDGGATGEGGNIIVIDDPHKAKDADSPNALDDAKRTYRETIANRMNDPSKDAIIVIMQRLHERDLSGYLIDSEGDTWRHVCLAAEYDPDHPFGFEGDWRTTPGEPLWPERIGSDVLSAIRDRLGSFAYSGQYGQTPTERAGGMFKKADFKVVDRAPRNVAARVRAWDFAASDEATTGDPDYTVGMLLSLVEVARQPSSDSSAPDLVTYDVYLEHEERGRLSPAQVDDRIKSTAELDGPEIPVRIPQDPGSGGKYASTAIIGKLAGFDIQAKAPTGSKVARARPLSAQAEIGRVHLVRAPWNQDYLDEMAAFPRGAHDDRIDATADAYNAALEIAKENESGRHDFF